MTKSSDIFYCRSCPYEFHQLGGSTVSIIEGERFQMKKKLNKHLEEHLEELSIIDKNFEKLLEG